MAPSTRRNKLIVGIDYATTYSGLSFALNTATDYRDIVPWTKYPGAASHSAEHSVKAPTRIAFARENQDLEDDAWGYQIEPGMNVCAFTKLLLDQAALPSEFDDPDLYNDSCGGMMRLPEGKTAKDVATAYLQQVFKMFEAECRKKFASLDFDDLPIDFWLTVPASWSEKAKLLTKSAARNAGFGARPIDRLMLISEPEAAAQYTLKSSLHRMENFVKAKTGVMVCDCGGGTVDIATYEVEEAQPLLKLREIAVGIAGKCGGSYVDRNFFKLLARRFGDAFTALRPEQIGPGSPFMDQFEQKKKDFSVKTPNKRALRIPLFMPNLQNRAVMDKHYERHSSSVLLTHEDMQAIFDPVVATVLRLIDDQLTRTKADKETPISTIVLVGGFASSPYLSQRIVEWCKERDITLTTPMSGAWSAVVCGAVMRGIDGSVVREKKCRKHYGHEISHPYKPRLHRNYDKERRTVWKDNFKRCQYLDGFMMWEVQKGARIDEDTEINSLINYLWGGDAEDSGVWELFACSLDNAPETIESDHIEKVGEVTFSLSAANLKKASTIHRDGVKWYSLTLSLNIRLNDDSGHLVFRILQDGKEIGQAQINMEE